MAFVDELTIFARAGRGGDGVVRWRRERAKPLGGPAGGDGGRGGDVYVKAVRDIGALAKLRFKKEFAAGKGENGKGSSMHGGNGKDLGIQLPVGAEVTNTDTGKVFELLKEGERILILKGGNGGYGNEHFKGAANQRPREWTPGRDGEQGTFFIELKLVVDAGFIGFPNAGKSSLLNSMTRAKARVGEYQFTTLDPNLGDFYGYILADIPGLIEGASQGKGLGHKFLRHIQRTKLVIHCISFERDDLWEAYQAIRTELELYGGLAEKEEVVVLTKGDLVSKERRVSQAKALSAKTGREVFTVSVLDDLSVKQFSDALIQILRKKSASM